MVKAKVKQIKPKRMIYIRYVGPYDDIPYKEYFKKVTKQARKMHTNPKDPIVIFFDDPEETPAKECRAEVGVITKKRDGAGREFRIRNIPSMKTAISKFEGTSKDYPNVYRDLYAWIDEQGLKPKGAPFEIYKNTPKNVREGGIIKSIIHIPVVKKEREDYMVEPSWEDY